MQIYLPNKTFTGTSTDWLIKLFSHDILLLFYIEIGKKELDADEELKVLRQFNADYKIALSQLSY